MATEEVTVDVLIIGSGPLGCTFAKKLLDVESVSVTIVDIGAQMSARPGENVKNAAFFQSDIDSFTGIVQAHLHLLSVPSNSSTVPTLDPSAFHFDVTKYDGYVQKGQNPNQDPYFNLPNAAATYAIGGMATHWTACTPRENAEGNRPERSDLLTKEEWELLYQEAEILLNTHNNVFDHSIRQQAILQALLPQFPDIVPLPLGVERVKNDSMFLVKWTGADNVLGENNIQLLNVKDSRFSIKSQHICLKLNTVTDVSGNIVESALVKDFQTGKKFLIRAKFFVVAAGAILTPQLLFASEIRPDALGRYLCEQPMTFCQIVLSNKIIDGIASSESDSIKQHVAENLKDPVPIPMDDPNPQLWWPVNSQHLYHCQIHRDSFAYGGVVPNVDTRLIVDLRWFGRSTPCRNNCVSFATDCKDVFGMPQPTFHFQLSEQDSEDAGLMMKEMCEVATTLGGFLPGAEPSFLKPGTALHITGTTRMGLSKKTVVQGGADEGSELEDHVVDTDSRVLGYTNLYIGSCGVIPTGTSCNPTLTAVALAVRAADHLITQLKIKETVVLTK